MKTSPTLTAMAALLTALAISPSVLAAGVDTSNPSLPVLYPVGQYLTAQNLFAAYHGPGLVIVLDMSPLRAFGPINSFPSGPNETEQFNATLNGMISVNGSPDQPANSSGPATTEAFNKVGLTTGTFNTEMLSLNLSGNSPFGPYMIRESPTLASTGQTTITGIGGGMFHIDSFFDVFTELSVDGGNTWIPSDTSTHVILEPVPEPSACLLAGVAGLFGLRRFGRRS